MYVWQNTCNLHRYWTQWRLLDTLYMYLSTYNEKNTLLLDTSVTSHSHFNKTLSAHSNNSTDLTSKRHMLRQQHRGTKRADTSHLLLFWQLAYRLGECINFAHDNRMWIGEQICSFIAWHWHRSQVVRCPQLLIAFTTKLNLFNIGHQSPTFFTVSSQWSLTTCLQLIPVYDKTGPWIGLHARPIQHHLPTFKITLIKHFLK